MLAKRTRDIILNHFGILHSVSYVFFLHFFLLFSYKFNLTHTHKWLHLHLLTLTWVLILLLDSFEERSSLRLLLQSPCLLVIHCYFIHLFSICLTNHCTYFCFLTYFLMPSSFVKINECFTWSFFVRLEGSPALS